MPPYYYRVTDKDNNTYYYANIDIAMACAKIVRAEYIIRFTLPQMSHRALILMVLNGKNFAANCVEIKVELPPVDDETGE